MFTDGAAAHSRCPHVSPESLRLAIVGGGKKVSDGNAEGLRKVGNDADGRIPLAAFNATDVRPVATCATCELFLCPPTGFTKHPHAAPESLLDRHGPKVRRRAADRSRADEYYSTLAESRIKIAGFMIRRASSRGTARAWSVGAARESVSKSSSGCDQLATRFLLVPCEFASR